MINYQIWWYFRHRHMTEVIGALSIYIIVHYLSMQNWKRLKIWVWASYEDIFLCGYLWHRRIVLESGNTALNSKIPRHPLRKDSRGELFWPPSIDDYWTLWTLTCVYNTIPLTRTDPGKMINNWWYCDSIYNKTAL